MQRSSKLRNAFAAGNASLVEAKPAVLVARESDWLAVLE